MVEITRAISIHITLLPFLLSAAVLFKNRDKKNGILFFVFLASLIVGYYGEINRYFIEGTFIIQFRIYYDLLEHILLVWYCASLIKFRSWERVTGIASVIIFVVWIYLGTFTSNAAIMDNLGTFEMIEQISLVLLSGFALMKQVELNYKEDNYGEQVLLFATLFYSFSTVVILGLFNTAIGKDHYYIHNISASIKTLLFSYGFWLIIKREKKKKGFTEFKTKPTEFKTKPTELQKS